MEYIKQWTFSVCMTLIVAVILSLMSSSGSMGRFYKAVISLFMITSFIVPLSGFDFEEFNMDIDTSDSSISSSQVYDNSVESLIKKTLNDGGYKSCNVKANTAINGDEVTIDNVTVTVPSEYDANSVSSFLYDKIGIVANVKNIGD